MGVVPGDEIGGLLQRGEALVGPLGHEGTDALGAGGLHVGDDVHEHDGPGHPGRQLAPAVSVAINLTADDLAKLGAAEIKALFQRSSGDRRS